MSGQPRAHEPTLQDPRPREQRRSRSSLRHVAAGAMPGAARFALVSWGISTVTDHGYPVILNPIALVVGGGVGMGILPFVSLARQDGTDANIVKRRPPGPADVPIRAPRRSTWARRCARAHSASTRVEPVPVTGRRRMGLRS